MKEGDEAHLERRKQGVHSRVCERNRESGMEQWRKRKIEGLTYKGKCKRQRFPTVDVATCTLVREYGETSPQGTVHVASLTRHVGRRRRAVSLFIRTSSSSSLGGLCTGPERWAGCWHRHLYGAGKLGGLVDIMGHVSGPSKIHVLKPVYVRVDQRKCMSCVYYIRGLAQVNTHWRRLGPRALGFPGVSCMHDT